MPQKLNASSARKAIQNIQPGVRMANQINSTDDSTVVIPSGVLPKRKAWGPFGFSHLGTDGGGDDQVVIVGDTDGEIATKLGLSATAFGTPSGCTSNAALNKQLDNEPVVIGKIALEYGDITQKAKSIKYAVLHPDGEVEVKDIAPLIQSQLDSGKYQGLIDNAAFADPIVLGSFGALIYTVADTKTLKAVHHPATSRR
jgi:hypothetical protein